MLNLSNAISLIRAPLAFLFLIPHTKLRLTCLTLAMISDFFDGFIARKTNTKTVSGAILDPLMDKFFMLFVLATLYLEHQFSTFEVLAMLSRDFALALYLLFMLLKRSTKTIVFQSIITGKIMTGLQFLIIYMIILNYCVPEFLYYSLVGMGVLALVELFQLKPKNNSN